MRPKVTLGMIVILVNDLTDEGTTRE